jgi:hypothetical protein
MCFNMCYLHHKSIDGNGAELSLRKEGSVYPLISSGDTKPVNLMCDPIILSIALERVVTSLRNSTVISVKLVSVESCNCRKNPALR